MRFLILPLLIAAPVFCADRIPAQGGDIVINPITHATVEIDYNGKVIYVDPWSQGDFSHTPPADLILITGAENDHLDTKAIAKVRKSAAVPVVIPAAGKDQVPDGVVMENGQQKDVAGIRIEAVPAYDLIPGNPFHPKGRGNGYIVTLGGKRLYFGGVTECVPEVRALTGIDVAFLAMNLPHGRMTMTAAADCVKSFKPKIVYPYHYRTGKVEEFKAALAGEPVDVRLAEWYPNGQAQ